MNKTILTRIISEKTNLTLNKSKQFLDALIFIVAESMEINDDVIIPNFGRFYKAPTKGRTSYNYLKKKNITTTDGFVIKFKAFSDLKDKCNSQ